MSYITFVVINIPVCFRPATESGYMSNSTGRQVSEQSLLSEHAVDAMLRVRDRTDQLRYEKTTLETQLYLKTRLSIKVNPLNPS